MVGVTRQKSDKNLKMSILLTYIWIIQFSWQNHLCIVTACIQTKLFFVTHILHVLIVKSLSSLFAIIGTFILAGVNALHHNMLLTWSTASNGLSIIISIRIVLHIEYNWLNLNCN